MYGLSRRYGKFYLTEKQIVDDRDACDYLLSKVLILETKFDFVSNRTEYLANSNEFCEVPEGDEVPFYFVTKQCEEYGLDYLGFIRY